MNIKNESNFSDIFNIRQIKTDIKITSSCETDNFREFQRIYGPIFTKKLKESQKLLYNKPRENSRPLAEVRTIQLEIPKFGSESAVVNNKKKNIAKQQSKEVQTKIHQTIIKTKEKNISTSTHSLIKKLSQMENSLRMDPKVGVHQTTSTILDITNKEIQVANEQLEQIKKLIEQKQAETQTLKLDNGNLTSKKMNRHRKCHQKNYESAIHTMQKKIKELENKYFKRPRVLYKNVKDTFTQLSQSVQTIFHSDSISNNKKLDETLEVAISELEDIVNTDISKKLQESPQYFKEIKEDDKLPLYLNNDEGLFNRLHSYEQQSPMDTFQKNSNTNKAFIKKPNQAPPVSPVESVEEYFIKIQRELLSRQPEKVTTPISPFCSNRKSPSTNLYSKAIDDFLAGNDLDDVSHSSANSSPGREQSKQVQPKHVRIEHVLAKNWSGDYKSDNESKIPIDGLSDRKEEQETGNKPIKTFTETMETINITEQYNKTAIPLTYSFKKLYSDNDYNKNDSLSQVIDSSEKRLSKYRNIKQDVNDVTSFCDTLYNIVKTDDEEEINKPKADLQNSIIKKKKNISKLVNVNSEDDGENIFESSKLQESVMKSCYLMKEFQIKPKIFREESSLFSKKSEVRTYAEKCTASGDKNMSQLFENLQNALENSIYRVEPHSGGEVCLSKVAD